MGRKAFIAVAWLISAWTVTGSKVKDNESATSARLYRNAKGIYASAYAGAAPHGAFSFHVPTAVPAASASKLIPVKQESIVIQNSNGFLKDSYGNKFVETPTSVAYKATFPQQFVQLQHLPAHLAQPLAAAPALRLPPGAPQAFFGPQLRLHALDAVTSPLTRYGSLAHPFVYAGNVNSLTPASDQQFHFGAPKNAQQDSSNKKVVYAAQGHNQLQKEPKFQRLEEKPHHNEYYKSSGQQASSVKAHNGKQNQHQEPKFQRLEENPYYNDYYDAPRQLASPSIRAKVQTPITHTVRTTHNGKDTIVQIETKPPLPLVDLSLLEPLTFADPIVPQVQHYLPTISPLTLQALHPQDAEDKNEKEFVVQKTKSYDSGVVKGQGHADAPKKKQKKPPKKDADVYINFESKSEKPSIKVKGKPNDPGYSYEIKSPGHKETFNQQVISYNKETKSDPVSYTYEKQTQKEPVTYSYSHNSNDPGQAKVQYVKKDPAPSTHPVYNFEPEQANEHQESSKPAPEESDDSNESSESDDEGPADDHAQYNSEPHHDKPSHSEHSSQSHQHHPNSDHPHHSSHSDHPGPSTHSYHSSHSDHPHPSTHSHHSSHSDHPGPSTHSHQSSHAPPTHSYSSSSSHPSPATYQTQSQHLQPEHKAQLNASPTPTYWVVSSKPQYYTAAASTPKLPTLHEYVENLRFLPSYPSPPSAAISVNPSRPPLQQAQYYVQQTTPRARSEGSLVSEPVIYEKSKKIIIQEESPEEVHSHQEKLTAQMETVGGDGDSEEDFEKSYKAAAYGFPAYDRDDSGETHDEVYKQNYGEPPQDHSGEESDDKHSPFEQYTEEGDQFPKSSRLSYKDDRDKVQEDYFLGYSLNKPQIMTDKYQSKIDYYKMFLKNKPEKLRVADANKKASKLSKYTVEPSFFDSAPKQKQKQSASYKSAAYKSAPVFEYSYDKEAPRDSSAFASRPSRYRSTTHFVEPQFQYGFEPIAIPRIDAEQETMATNLSPESDKPGTRKKLYKENWYIKKTTTSSKPS
ncbi:LIM domain-containing protein A-like [Leguminivora glycinivorella]|uniref:LIM domain-containing protein A-like n=1 Tax=Leguminivora glycinivorella TaxID=1035111 RepID=UPI00200C15F2|nr:LIM domain-containing protein A-like [Leguminivora glycinivorella]